MNFLRVYLTIGSVVAALRIMITIIATKNEPLKEAVNRHNPTTKWLMDRPWIQALNCLVSIVTWPLDLAFIIGSTMNHRKALRYWKKIHDQSTELFDHKDES